MDCHGLSQVLADVGAALSGKEMLAITREIGFAESAFIVGQPSPTDGGIPVPHTDIFLRGWPSHLRCILTTILSTSLAAPGAGTFTP